MTATRKFRARADVVFSDLADGAALLDLRSSMYYSVNAVGFHIWKLIQEPADLAAVVGAVAQVFDTTPEACAADVSAMIDKLVSADLAEIVGV